MALLPIALADTFQKGWPGYIGQRRPLYVQSPRPLRLVWAARQGAQLAMDFTWGHNYDSGHVLIEC